MPVNIKKDFRKDRERKPDASALVYGKVPPQAPDLEAAVLGAILLERQKREGVMAIIQSPECFYVDAHQKIYAAITSLHASGSPVDILTVAEELRRSSELEIVGGPYFITRLTMDVSSSAHAESHARIVVEKHMQRELIRISGMVIQAAYEDSTDVFDLMDVAEAQLSAISSSNLRRPYTYAPELSDIFIRNLQERIANPKEVSGVSSGYRALDNITNGWRPGNLIIIGAQSSVGKTAFALNLAINAAIGNVGVAFFSLEMEKEELINRIKSAMSHVPLDHIEKGNVEQWEQEEVFKSAAAFRKLKFIIDDSPALTAHELRSKARKMVDKDGIELILIDYLQLMHATIAKGGNREQEVAQITRDLKALAKELRIPIIALSQLNRAVEKSGGSNGKPMLSNLRESGAIEQDANIVMFLTRPDYQKTEEEVNPMMQDDADIHIAKNRGGKSGDTLAMKMVKSIQAWMDPMGYDDYKGVRWTDNRDKPEQPNSAALQSAGRNNTDYSQPKAQDDLPF